MNAPPPVNVPQPAQPNQPNTWLDTTALVLLLVLAICGVASIFLNISALLATVQLVISLVGITANRVQSRITRPRIFAMLRAIIVFLLVIVIILQSIILYEYFTNQRTQLGAVTPTPTPQTQANATGTAIAQANANATATALAILGGTCPNSSAIAQAIGDDPKNVSRVDTQTDACAFSLQKVGARTVHCPMKYGEVSFQYTLPGIETQYIRRCDGTETTPFQIDGATARFVNWEPVGPACIIYKKTPGSVLAPGTDCP